MVPSYADVLVKCDRRIGARHALIVLGIGAKDSASTSGREGPATTRSRATRPSASRACASTRRGRRAPRRPIVASLGSSEVDAKAVDGADRRRDRPRAATSSSASRADVRRTGTPVGRRARRRGGQGVPLRLRPVRERRVDAVRDRQPRPLGARPPVVHGRGRRTPRSSGRFPGGAGCSPASAWIAGARRRRHDRQPAREGGVRARALPAGRRATGASTARACPTSGWRARRATRGLAPIASRQFGGGLDVEPRPLAAAGRRGLRQALPQLPGRSRRSRAACWSARRPSSSRRTSARSSAPGRCARAASTPWRSVDARHDGSRSPRTTRYWHVSQLGLDNVWRSGRARGAAPGADRAAVPAGTGTGARASAGATRAGARTRRSACALSVKRGRAVYDLTQINALDYPAYSRIDVRDRSHASRPAAWRRMAVRRGRQPDEPRTTC